MPTKSVPVEELVKRFMSLGGKARVVSYVARTTPGQYAGSPYKGRVRKVCKSTAMINWYYERAVNRQRIREDKDDDFEALERSWGKRIFGTPFVEHKGKRYVEFKCEQPVRVVYFLDGVPLDEGSEQEADVKKWCKPSSKPKRQQLDKPVILRDYKIENIRQIDGLPSEAMESEYLVVEPLATSA